VSLGLLSACDVDACSGHGASHFALAGLFLQYAAAAILQWEQNIWQD